MALCPWIPWVHKQCDVLEQSWKPTLLSENKRLNHQKSYSSMDVGINPRLSIFVASDFRGCLCYPWPISSTCSHPPQNQTTHHTSQFVCRSILESFGREISPSEGQDSISRDMQVSGLDKEIKFLNQLPTATLNKPGPIASSCLFSRK